MLVLTRKKYETIQIAGNITIKVLKVGERQIKLGITAPRDVRIVRGEIKERKAA